MYALSEKFGWLPDQINELDLDDERMYLAILQGAGKAEPKDQKK